MSGGHHGTHRKSVGYQLTGGLFLIGWLYDLWTLNEQVDRINYERTMIAGSRTD